MQQPKAEHSLGTGDAQMGFSSSQICNASAIACAIHIWMDPT